MEHLESKKMELLSNFCLENQVAIVTGAGAGIGGGIAAGLATVGADVVVVTLHRETCEATAKEVRTLGRKALPMAIDITSSEQVKGMVDKAMAEFGRIDVLVNNVGGMPGGWCPMLEMADDDWDAVMNMSLKSAFLCSKFVGRVMKEQKSGSIINIASAAAFNPTPYNVAYGAAKAGVVSFTRSLAVYLAPLHIRVNCIAPGPVSTPGTSPLADAKKWADSFGVLLGRCGTPEDIAFAAIYLASKAADFVTGAVIEVSGGPRLASTYLKEAEEGWKKIKS